MSTATPNSGRSHARFTFFVCFMAALAGLLFGLDIGVIAGALPFLSTDLHIDNRQQELVVSSMMFGAAVGALAAGWMSAKLGRKFSLLTGAVLFISGSLWAALSPNVESLIIARILLGLAIGIASYYRSALPVGNRAGKDPRFDDLHVSVDDHHRDPRGLSL